MCECACARALEFFALLFHYRPTSPQPQQKTTPFDGAEEGVEEQLREGGHDARDVPARLAVNHNGVTLQRKNGVNVRGEAGVRKGTQEKKENYEIRRLHVEKRDKAERKEGGKGAKRALVGLTYVVTNGLGSSNGSKECTANLSKPV